MISISVAVDDNDDDIEDSDDDNDYDASAAELVVGLWLKPALTKVCSLVAAATSEVRKTT